MGYAYTGAPPCSMCKDNTTDLSTKCMAMIDCIEKSYPCTGNCQTNCLNMSGGSGVLSTCVNALVSAACGPETQSESAPGLTAISTGSRKRRRVKMQSST